MTQTSLLSFGSAGSGVQLPAIEVGSD